MTPITNPRTAYQLSMTYYLQQVTNSLRHILIILFVKLILMLITLIIANNAHKLINTIHGGLQKSLEVNFFDTLQLKL